MSSDIFYDKHSFFLFFSFFTSIFAAKSKQKAIDLQIYESTAKIHITLIDKILQLVIFFCFACFGVARAEVTFDLVPFNEPYATTSVFDGWNIYYAMLDNVMNDTVNLSPITDEWYFGNYNGAINDDCPLISISTEQVANTGWPLLISLIE